ncbi:hypothetical protein GCM10010082_29500 [Kushneria pakistanensis]|uniref:Endonuclease GajA/Old nuclease/RecF-like AAA domain-containing protein n=1 Tax=Kushneria pakistanensis TaxID=1508770 RepID=A0ABQ3FPT5_9GAMM|nr:AAA family ATPase [Kushneria pakistanensis]GHC33039.1 hypothetical protein GCM10010082_29500 [Kushneria pakistanensis]
MVQGFNIIIGIILKYYKTYKGINYIPITDMDNFCGLVGENGIGKSSVLEALDTFFNGRAWNYNTTTKKRGVDYSEPQIVPLFLIDRESLSASVQDLARELHEVTIGGVETDVNSANKANYKIFAEHRNRLSERVNLEEKYLIPIGINHCGDIATSIFNNRRLVEVVLGQSSNSETTSLDEVDLQRYQPLLQELKTLIEYIYIPKEIDSNSFTKLETKEIQVLMGETLIEILSTRVTAAQIQEINSSLIEFIDTLSDELEDYSYRTPTDRQQRLKKNDVYNLIIQAFFNTRRLHKKQGANWLEISALSSGEKQKAIVDIAHSLLNKHRSKGSNLIVGIDEPETSLHMSACFDQFDALYDISRQCMQIFFASHWYGFLPTVEQGSTTVITKKEDHHFFDQINLSEYREQVKRLATSSRGRLPYDIRLKSMNDFIQSIITSVIGDNPFSWIICEGSSEKVYLSSYLKDLLQDKRIRIVPVGGAKEIKRVYNHLSTSYEDFKKEVSGKMILISDTDEELVNYKVSEYENLKCKRLVLSSEDKITRLVNIDSNPVSPATEIEDCLNGKLFLETLRLFSEDYSELVGFVNDIDLVSDELDVKFALDIKSSEWEKIKRFFDCEGVKYRFARKYVDTMKQDHAIPSWVLEVRKMLE